jgi:hypothetical protein
VNALIDEPRDVTRLRRVVALFALLLFASTWPLWTPQTAFPQVPLLFIAGQLSNWCDWLLFGLMLVAMAIVLFANSSSRWWRRGCALFVAAFVASVLIDQHRLQPWAYQFALVAAVLALVSDRRGLSLLRILTIGIYVHSALSKFDFSFIETNGQYLVGGVTNVWGIDGEKWNPTQRRVVAAMLPLGELAVGVGLCFRITRRLALAFAVVMHALLMVALGPWSLDHELGVLIWNAYFIVQNVLLFWSSHTKTAVDQTPTEAFLAQMPSPLRVWTARSIVALAMTMPFLEPFGLFDPWPSWAVYASRPARARVLIDNDAKHRLPPELQPYVAQARFDDLRCPVRVDRWSLDATHAPIYPSSRFSLGVALALARLPGLEDKVWVEFESAADRRTGKRTSRKVGGAYDLRLEAYHFWFNANPR